MPSVLAVFAHPDDIEFVAAGTLIRLRDRGWDVHYMNVANGCCGSMTTGRAETAMIREQESRNSAALLGAEYYPPICNDLEIDYSLHNLAKIVSVVRRAKPSIVLTHAHWDYMEDHMQTCRLALTAAFARGVPNFPSDPAETAWEGDVVVYHAQPHGNRTPLGEYVHPGLVVAIDEVMDRKLQMLQQHRSQQDWLKSTQGLNSYCQTMMDLCSEVASRAKTESGSSVVPSMKYAEGWRKHLHLGYSGTDRDPLREIFVETTG